MKNVGGGLAVIATYAFAAFSWYMTKDHFSQSEALVVLGLVFVAAVGTWRLTSSRD